jgi:hypothetical protein
VKKQFFYIADIVTKNDGTYPCDGVVTLDCSDGVPYTELKQSLIEGFYDQGKTGTPIGVNMRQFNYLMDITN